MMNNLYPLKFNPIYKTKIWGGDNFSRLLNRKATPEKCGESWDISGVEGCESVVANGFLQGNTLAEVLEIYMGDLVGERVYERFGLDFPLLVKLIDAHDDLSVQVHPNDDLAAERHKSYGKTEMWYVLAAEPGARLLNGFLGNVDRSQYVQALGSGRVLDIMNRMEVRKGDVSFIPAGRVHAIGSGIMVAEVQQTSDITYRIYDYDRTDSQGNKRELHTDMALDAIDFGGSSDSLIDCRPKPNESLAAVDCEYFTTNIFRFDKPVEKDFPEIDSFIIYMCVDGACSLEYDDGQRVHVALGESVLVPACISSLCFYPEGDTRLLEIYIKGE